MEAFIEQRKRASPKGRIYLRAKRVGQWPLLSRTKCSAQENSRLRGVRSFQIKSPFVRTGFQLKQARQSPDLQHSMVAWRGFEPPISALRGRRPKPLDDQAMRASIKQLD